MVRRQRSYFEASKQKSKCLEGCGNLIASEGENLKEQMDEKVILVANNGWNLMVSDWIIIPDIITI